MRVARVKQHEAVEHHRATIQPKWEHSIPWFWPYAAAIELGDEGLDFFNDNLKFVGEAAEISAPPRPEWATPNHVILDLNTMRLRDFSKPGASGVPVLIDPPYAGHHSTIADYAKGQSLVETLIGAGLDRVLTADWKAASDVMKNFDIDKYLAEINVVVDDLGGAVHLIGLCQGGWMSAMFASRFPEKVKSLVLAGAPIDTDAGHGPIKKLAHTLPLETYREMVDIGDGRMLGKTMLAGWKDMHPGKQFFGKYLDLFAHIEDRSYIKRTEQFERWYENPIDLPGVYYLQAIKLLFKENRFAKGTFVGLGRKLALKDIKVPVYLLAGDADDITTKEQVFNAENLIGTPSSAVVKKIAPGGHIGLFMGRRTLAETWPGIGRWIQALQREER
jgi:poly(3-hydroxybutyrate) depolymerase